MRALELAVVFAAGLGAGLHCLQMCGPIVLAYSLPLARGQAWRAHLLYNSGRITTYMLLGALTGAAGGALGLLGRMAGIAAAGRIIAGGAMVLAGIAMLAARPASGLITIQRSGRGAGFLRAAGRMVRESRNKFLLGVTLGFLPCGLVYAALLKAMESASAAGGALTMLAFGIGTAVALLAMGAVSTLTGARLGRYNTRVAAVAVVLFGAILLWRGIAARPVCHG